MQNVEKPKVEECVEFLKSVLDGVAEPIIAVGLDYRIIFSNKAALAYSETEKPQYCYQVFHHKDSPCPGENGGRTLCTLEEVRRTGGDVRLAHEHHSLSGERRYIEILASPLRDEAGGVKGIIESWRDITEHKKTEERLEASLREKEVLLREVHHRVKNNMQVITSLLRLQARYIEDEKYAEIFKESQNRIKSMLFVHEKLYESKDFANIDFGDYIKKLATGLLRSYEVSPEKAIVSIDAGDVKLGVDTAIPCGLIINELVTNSLKHAFPGGPGGKPGEISITLRPADTNTFVLTVSDNGVGIPPEMDFRKTKSLGLQLVVSLVGQLGGTIAVEKTEGTTFIIIFKGHKDEKGGS